MSFVGELWSIFSMLFLGGKRCIVRKRRRRSVGLMFMGSADGLPNDKASCILGTWAMNSPYLRSRIIMNWI